MNVTDKSGFKSLLMLAVNTGNDETVKLLTEAGADVNIKDTETTPLILAVQSGNEEFVKQLIKTGVDVNLTNARGDTAVMLALKNNQANGVNLLLAAGADVNMANKSGETTLHYALETGNPDFIRMMIKAGADRWGHQLICKLMRNARMCTIETSRKIGMLLCAGTYVNIYSRNARIFYDQVIIRLLFAAGERMYNSNVNDLVPAERRGLLHLCREAIREHLLQMSNVNLFVRIPELGLPSQMVDYLLYGVSLSDIGKHLQQMN